jgi:hypothetical protein
MVPRHIGVGLSVTVWMLGRDGPLAWPPRSPDITPLDFFLWGYVKDKVYVTKVTGVEDLKKRIRDVITTITRGGMLARTWEELEFDRLFSVRHTVPTLKCAECIKKNFMYVSNKISFTFFLAIYNF